MAAVLILLIFASLSVGCADDLDDMQSSGHGSSLGDSLLHPEFIYVPEVVSFPDLPDGLTDITNVALTDSAVYFTSRGHRDENFYGLFSMDFNGTNLTELTDFTAGTALPDGFIDIGFLHADNKGYLWVLESTNLYDPGREKIDTFITIRKLDKTGAEILAFDITDRINPVIAFLDNVELTTDDAGNIYLATRSDIYVFDEKGNLLFNLEKPEIDAYLVYLSTGSVSLAAWSDTTQHLRKIDAEIKSWGETTGLPSDIRGVRNVFSGNEKYIFLYNTKSYLTGVLAETGESVNILGWIDSNISPNNINNVMLLHDGRIAATRQIQNRTSGASPVIELLLFTKTSIEELPEKIILTFGTFRYESNISSLVEQFNANSETHRIQVIDYSLVDPDYSHGILKLNTEMITGSGPDILDVWILPVHNYAPKGFLVDLYPLIDADHELNRSSFIESVLKALETNGSLYRISPSFLFNTVFGNPAVLGEYPGWNMDEFINVLNENPQADKPIGFYSSSMYFLSIILSANLDEYIDRVSGTAYFDSDEFIDLLELANTFPSEIDQSQFTPESFFMYIISGQQIMEMRLIGSLHSLLEQRTSFGGEIVFKGFPTENRDGNVFTPQTSIAISSSCKDIDAAWEFVRMFLTEDYQREITLSIPINKVVFEERIEEIMIETGRQIITNTGNRITIEPFSQEEADMLRSVIDNTTRLRGEADNTIWMIVTESAEDFFNGTIIAQDAARIIQSRVTIYLAEQN